MSGEVSNDYRALACDRCSRRKQRCDRKLPTCSQCEKAGAACENGEREVMVTRTSDGDVQRKGYVKQLEERVAHLEAQIKVKRLRVDLAQRRSGSPEPSTAAISRRLSETAESHVNEGQAGQNVSAEMSIGLLSMSAMAEPRNRAGEFLRELSMPRIISAMTETYGGNPESTVRIDALWDGIAKYIRQSGKGVLQRLEVPRADALKSLNTYLDVVDFRYPRLPVEKVMQGIDAITAENETVYKTTLSSDPARIFLAYMVLAVVPLVSDIYPVSQGSFISIHLLSKSLKVLDRVFQMEDGVDIIQCLHLLVIFSIHSSAAGSSWHLIGVAMKKCIAFGCHREGSKGASNITHDDSEQRRWAFWSCYVLDRLISSALGRPFSIDDSCITVKFPGDSSSSYTTLTPAEVRHVHLFRYSVLQSVIIHDNGRRSFTYHLSHLLHWRASTPEHLEPYPPRVSSYLVSLYNTLLLRITIDQILASQDEQDRPNSPLPSFTSARQRPISNRESQSEQLRYSKTRNEMQMRMFDTCRAVIESLNRTSMKHRSFLSWITGYSAFSVALTTLHCMNVLECASQEDDLNIPSVGSTSSFPQENNESRAAMRPQALLDAACRTLEVVARQFPRMQIYCHVVRNLQKTISITQGQSTLDSTQANLSNDTDELIKAIGPDHLCRLAQIVHKSTFPSMPVGEYHT